MRFVHIADVHLDTPFAGRSAELRGRLRQACRDALGRAVELALEERVDAFLIAGDLFDADLISLQTEGFLVDQMRRLGQGGIPVVYATGNHDPGAGGSGLRSLSWPRKVTVVGHGDPVTVEIRDEEGRLVGRVTAAGHENERVTEDLAARFPPPGGDVPEVALLHTQVRGTSASDEHDPYAPSELSALRASGYDYWALGHVHTRQALSEAPPIHYPGNVQGRTPRETGPRGCLLVDLTDRSAPSVSFHPLGSVRWEHLRVSDLEEANSHHHLLSAVADRWSALASERTAPPGTEFVVVVELRGPSPLWERFREEGESLEGLEEDLAGRLGVLAVELRVEGLQPDTLPARHRERQDVLGETLRLLERVRNGEEELPGLESGVLGGLDPRSDRSQEEYVRELLRDAEGEVLARLLRSVGERGGPR